MPFGNNANQIRFEDVTRQSGLFSKSQSWGVFWGDYNNDGRPDPLLHGHQQKPVKLYRNLGNGTFLEVAQDVINNFRTATRGDFHGAAWGDFDNDGDQDLLQLSGGDLGAADDNPSKNNKLFVNNNNRFTDRAAAKGVQYPLGRARVALWFDIDRDGRNDFVYSGPPRPDGRSRPTVFRQTNAGNFDDIGDRVRLSRNVPNGTFAMMSDLDNNNIADLVYYGNQPTLTAYKTNTRPFQSLNRALLSNIPDNLNIKDLAIADFNGDARPDIYIAQQGSPKSGFRTDTGRKGKAVLDILREEQGINFQVNGKLKFNFQRDFNLSSPSYFLNTTITAKDIYIGRNGVNPDSLVFNLDPTKQRYQGIAPHNKGGARGVYIGFNQANNTWQVRFSSPKKDQLNFIYSSNKTIGKITPVGFAAEGGRKQDYLFIYDPQKKKFVDRSNQSGIRDLKIPSRNVVAADFDNDRDLDLYVVATRNTKNVANVLLENRGNGQFRKVQGGAGLAGTAFGIGDAVAVADYNLDGFLEPLVTNGDVLGFSRPFLADGSPQLFRNRGNNNHWIQIDLRGRASNRDGVGAKVYVTTNGVRQLREQNGGIHNRGQNFQRLHFGLGTTRNIDKLEVRWPSGKRQIFRNVRGDRIIEIDENRNTITVAARAAGIQALPIEGENNAVLDGDRQNNRLIGTTNNEILRGQDGDDILQGKGGDDQLVGGRGADITAGGRGNDQFKFQEWTEGGDTILDFKSGKDTIVISKQGFDSDLATGEVAEILFARGAHRVNSHTRFIYRPMSQDLLFDPDGNGSQSAKILAKFDASVMLKASDLRIQ